MALTTFHFQASFPASRAFLEPLEVLVRHVMAYTEYPAAEAETVAGDIRSVVANSMPEVSGAGPVTIQFDRREGDLHIDVTADHLPPSAPPAGLMDGVTVHRHGSATTYRYQRRVPAA